MSELPQDDLPCRLLVEIATEHLEGALDPDTERRLVEHLAGCPGCTDFVEQLRTTGALTALLRDRETSAGVEAAAVAAYRARRGHRL